MKRKFLLLLMVQICLLPNIHSQKLHFQQYSILEGLPHSTVFSVLQDSRGFLWVGTDGGGLARTDGVVFEVFNNTNGLPGNVVRALFEDSKQRIWIGTDKGLSCYDGKQFRIFDADPRLIGANILAIAEDNHGQVLLGTHENGLFILKVENDTTVTNISRNEGLIGPFILDIEVSEDNRYWLSMVGGINVVSIINGEIDVMQLKKGIHLPGDVITRSEKDHVGNIWFGSQDRGIFLIPDKADLENHVAEVPEYLKFLSNETIWDIYWADTSTCWIATDRLGLIKMNHNRVYESITRDNGLPTNRISRIHDDGSGGIWLATPGNGIQHYGGDLFTKFELNPNRIGIDVSGMVEEAPGIILAATDEGLYRIISGKETEPFSKKINLKGIPAGSAINSIAIDQKGIIWLGTNYGLYEIRGNTAKYSDINSELGRYKINTIFVDSENLLWVGTVNGYNLVIGDNVYSMNEESGLIHNEIQTIIQDRKGNIWMGTLGGLVLRNAESYQDFNEEDGLTSLQIHTLAEAPDGNIWIGTFGGGIYVLDPDSEPIHINKVKGNQKLTSPNIYSLIWEDEHSLIACTESGFDKITISGDSIHSIIHFDSGDGFCEGSNNLNAVLKSSDGTIWFGTSSSLVSQSPRGSKRVSAIPIAYIDELRLDFQEQDWSKDFQVSPWFHLPEDLVLPHHQNHLTFDYTAIHFDNPDDLQFSYFLEGQSKSWSPFSIERSTTFQGLSPGDYKFRLITRTKFGIESEEESFSFKILPPFWLTAWFLITSFAILVFIILLVIRLRVRKLKREKANLERIVELRTWELTQQKEQIEEQRDVVLSQQKEITESFQYAEKIQIASLPEGHELSECFTGHFIMLKPQHIVSGDFYWIGQKNEHIIFTAVDCTGHGVPGALMSMLGVSFLNKIVNEDGLVKPAEILNELRQNIINAFHKTKDFEEGSRDGMDVALCSYDMKLKKLYFSGAMNPLYQIRKTQGEYELIEHLPDKMPVANHTIMNSFSQKEVELKKGDALYLFSDGFSDQFGGERGKKFMKKRFKQMLLDHQDLSMSHQKEAFEKTLADWMKGDGKKYVESQQTDDVIILGVKV